MNDQSYTGMFLRKTLDILALSKAYADRIELLEQPLGISDNKKIR